MIGSNRNFNYFILPCILILLAINIYPLLYSIYISFHSLSFSSQDIPFVGFSNFIEVLKNPVFWYSIQTTFLFVVVAVSIEMVLGSSIALLLNQNLVGKGLYVPLITIPMMVTPIAVATIWKFMYLPSWGIINYFLSLIGIRKIAWLSGAYLPLFSVMFVDIWQWTPFVTLLALAGLQSISSTPYEAAEIDGASSFQRLMYITLPILRPTLFVILLLRIIDSFKVFDAVYVLTSGGPGRATEVISINIFHEGFNYFRIDRASASSLIFLIIITIISLFLIKLLGSEEKT